MSTQWPLVQARLVELLPTLSGWGGTPVYDGAPDSGDATDTYCAVGFVEDEQGAGSFSFEPHGSGAGDIETGEVRSELYSGNGDGDIAAARAAGFALIDSLKAYLIAHRDLGTLAQGTSCSLSADVVTGKAQGAGQFLTLTVAYTSPFTP